MYVCNCSWLLFVPLLFLWSSSESIGHTHMRDPPPASNRFLWPAAILGFHSMMNQDQYHASLLGKRIESDVGWAGITRATRPKPMAPEPPNMTDPEQSIERLRQDEPDLLVLNLNNIKVSWGGGWVGRRER